MKAPRIPTHLTTALVCAVAFTNAIAQQVPPLKTAADVPGAAKESNWLPASDDKFSLNMRCYWSKQAILDGIWIPPQVELLK